MHRTKTDQAKVRHTGNNVAHPAYITGNYIHWAIKD